MQLFRYTILVVVCIISSLVSGGVYAADSKPDAKLVLVPLNRSSLISTSTPMAEVMIANPEIADVHAHNETTLTLVGKKLGRTTVRLFDGKGGMMREFEVVVGQDLPAIRRALKNFFPDEAIGAELVNTSIALTGRVSNAAVAEKAVKIVKDFMDAGAEEKKSGGEENKASSAPSILNLMQVASGQQVMLRVRVGEINRTALKNLGVNISGEVGGTQFGSGIAGLAGLLPPVDTDNVAAYGPGSLIFPTGSGGAPADTQGLIVSSFRLNGSPLAASLQALERDGLFKLLAEPNLVAVSGEQAEFLAGGEIPVPVVQGGNSTAVSIEYKPFGVAVKFTPFVLTENRIRMAVYPEVSEISTDNSVTISGFNIPSLTTRRAKTTVELAPGESFMIAGLLKDQIRSTIDQIPGAKELPVLGALFRSSAFQRSETELVIAVTPYMVDPMKSSDVKLPTDNFRPASQMETYFFGALGSVVGAPPAATSQTPVEGPIGFMVD